MSPKGSGFENNRGVAILKMRSRIIGSSIVVAVAMHCNTHSRVILCKLRREVLLSVMRPTYSI